MVIDHTERPAWCLLHGDESPAGTLVPRVGMHGCERSFTHGGKIGKRQQKCESATLDRLPQPLHGELDILRLQLAPALDLSLIAVLGEALEVFRGQPPGCPAF